MKNESFVNALKSIETDEERERTQNFAQELFLSFISGFEQIKKTVQENPDKMAEALKKDIDKK